MVQCARASMLSLSCGMKAGKQRLDDMMQRQQQQQQQQHGEGNRRELAPKNTCIRFCSQPCLQGHTHPGSSIGSRLSTAPASASCCGTLLWSHPTWWPPWQAEAEGRRHQGGSGKKD